MTEAAGPTATFGLRVHEHGPADVMLWEELPLAPPGPGEVRIRHTAIGLNFIDVYHRTGLYPRALPLVPGVEAAGVVEQVGDSVEDFRAGDRIAYVLELGSYCLARNIQVSKVVHIPDGISDEIAAAALLKGLTAHFLLHRTRTVGRGDRILFHAAAGGVGLLACQWAKHLGAEVIGTVSSQKKAELASSHGCDLPIVTTEQDFVEEVRKATGGGVDVVYDSAGKDTFLKSLECLRDFGMLVLFGQSSGAVDPIDPNILQKGSVYLARPTLATHAGRRDLLVEGASAVFEAILDGVLSVEINQRFPLTEAVRAHRALEERATTGSSILTP